MEKSRVVFSPLIVVLLVVSGIVVIPQPIKAWMRIYGNISWDGGSYVEQTDDGGYVVTGFVNTGGKTKKDTWLLKTNSQGDTLWTRIIDAGTLLNDGSISVHETPNAGFMVFGNMDVNGSDGLDTMVIIRTNSAGNTLWTKKYMGRAYSAESTADGGFIVTGYQGKFIKMNSWADIIWSKTLEPGGCFAEETSDGGYIVTGSYLVKTDGSGNLEWEKTFSDVVGNCVRETSDKGFIIAGFKYYGSDWGDQTFYVLRTDSNGDSLWAYSLHMPSVKACCILEASAGEYLACAEQGYSGNEPQGGVIVKLDDSGDTIWKRIYGGGYSSCFQWMAKTMDGGYVLTGSTTAFNAKSDDLWLVKTDSEGYAFHKEVSADSIYNPGVNDHLSSLKPKARFVNKTDSMVSGFYCHYEIEQVTGGGGDFDPVENYYHDSILIQDTLNPADTITVEFPEWTYHQISDFDIFEITFYTTRDDDWGSMCKYWTFTGQPGAIDENQIPAKEKNWQPLTTIGEEIVLRFSGYPRGFQAYVYDASGRKVDKIKPSQTHGTIKWGEGHEAGVYFIVADMDPSQIYKVIIVK